MLINSMTSTHLNILLADDDIDYNSFFGDALKGIPIATHLTTVRDGEQLMAYLSKHLDHLPDVLFLDLSMPRKNGFECLIEIKEDEKLKNLPVILFSTAFPQDMLYEEKMITMLCNMGANSFIRKRGDFSILKQSIHQALIEAAEIKSKLSLSTS